MKFKVFSQRKFEISIVCSLLTNSLFSRFLYRSFKCKQQSKWIHLKISLLYIWDFKHTFAVLDLDQGINTLVFQHNSNRYQNFSKWHITLYTADDPSLSSYRTLVVIFGMYPPYTQKSKKSDRSCPEVCSNCRCSKFVSILDSFASDSNAEK